MMNNCVTLLLCVFHVFCFMNETNNTPTLIYLQHVLLLFENLHKNAKYQSSTHL